MVILKLIDIEYSAQYSVEHIIFIRFIKIKNSIVSRSVRSSDIQKELYYLLD